MIYYSIDIETTGLNPETCQILEFACVREDTSVKPLPPVETLLRFRKVVWHKQIVGEAYALQLNKDIIKESLDVRNKDVCSEQDLWEKFSYWVTTECTQSKIVCAGKNFGAFDLQFMKRLPCFTDEFTVNAHVPITKLYYRYLDPAMYFMRWEDTAPPDLAMCLKRAGIEKSVEHTGIADAQDVIRCLRIGSHEYASKFWE